MIQQVTWPSECECCFKGLSKPWLSMGGKYIFNFEKEERKKSNQSSPFKISHPMINFMASFWPAFHLKRQLSPWKICHLGLLLEKGHPEILVLVDWTYQTKLLEKTIFISTQQDFNHVLLLSSMTWSKYWLAGHVHSIPTNKAHSCVRPFCAASCSGVKPQRSCALTQVLNLISRAAMSTCWKKRMQDFALHNADYMLPLYWK